MSTPDPQDLPDIGSDDYKSEKSFLFKWIGRALGSHDFLYDHDYVSEPIDYDFNSRLSFFISHIEHEYHRQFKNNAHLISLLERYHAILREHGIEVDSKMLCKDYYDRKDATND